jgi:hypothetical protein
LPAIPPATLLTAAYLHGLRQTGRIKMLLHSLICGVLLGGALLAPWLMLKVHLTQPAWIWAATMTAIMASAVLLLVRYRGIRMLHFITLVPVVLALAFLLRFVPENANPVHGSVIDITRSARSVDLELRQLGVESGSIAIFNVPHQRELEYGLNFYRNQPIHLYVRDPIPDESHVVIAREGDEDAVQSSVGARKITPIGHFLPQRLQFFRVSNSK